MSEKPSMPTMPMKSKMAPPGMEDKKPMGKASPEDAQVIRADMHCLDCHNYDPTSGECSKVEGSFDPQDGCVKFFEAIGQDEPDDDDMGGEPAGDVDDMGGAQ